MTPRRMSIWRVTRAVIASVRMEVKMLSKASAVSWVIGRYKGVFGSMGWDELRRDKCRVC